MGPRGMPHPVFGEWASRSITSDTVLMLSFLELVELVIVGRFRRPPRPISLDRIRAAHKFARQTWHVAYPFASLNLLEFGGHLLHQFDEQYPGQPSQMMALDMGGQPTFPGSWRGKSRTTLCSPISSLVSGTRADDLSLSSSIRRSQVGARY